MENFMTDFDTVKDVYEVWPDCNCKVHCGFNSAQRSIADDLLEAIKDVTAIYPDAQLKLTGHSLGGALAQLSTMFLLKEGF